jgi:hypothetical protein
MPLKEGLNQILVIDAITQLTTNMILIENVDEK